jgi:hypothetical protein
MSLRLSSVLSRRTAIAFTERVMKEIENISALTRSGMSKPRKGSAQFIETTNFEISATLVRRAQGGANKLNAELVEFTTFLGSLRPPLVDFSSAAHFCVAWRIVVE